jgi:flagellar biosynthesis/type III secretory pathway protein FliH
LYSSVRPPIDALPPVAPAPPSLPTPPLYPDLRAEHGALQAQLAATVDAMAKLRRLILDETEPQLVALACAIGERIAGRELGSDPELVVAWAREAVDQIAGDGSVVVAVSSDIAASLQDAAWSPVRTDSVTIEEDATLAAGSCEVRGARASVDVSLASRAEGVRRAVVGSTT